MDLNDAFSIISSSVSQNNAWSAEQAQKQMDFQREMSDTAHQREVADLKAAGLNPVLSAHSNGASTPTGAKAEGDMSGTAALVSLLTEFGSGIANSAAGAAAYGASSGNSKNAKSNNAKSNVVDKTFTNLNGKEIKSSDFYSDADHEKAEKALNSFIDYVEKPIVSLAYKVSPTVGTVVQGAFDAAEKAGSDFRKQRVYDNMEKMMSNGKASFEAYNKIKNSVNKAVKSVKAAVGIKSSHSGKF